MRLITAIFLLTLTFTSARAQNAYDKLLGKKKKSNLTFYADEAGTEVITSLEAGQSEFYALLTLNKKDFKVPFGKFFGYAEVDIVPTAAAVYDIKVNHSVKDENIYYADHKLGKAFAELANNEGQVMIPFKIDDDINFMRNVEGVLEGGNNVYPLTIEIGKAGDNYMGYGVLEWDLTDGGQKYAESDLASRANYTFNATDDHNDHAFKALVKEDVERRYDVKIYQMAHGDRVPYTRGLNFYRRNQIGITYQDLEDGNCYTGGIAAFEDGGGTGETYKYDMEGQLSQGDQIPCDRVDK